MIMKKPGLELFRLISLLLLFALAALPGCGKKDSDGGDDDDDDTIPIGDDDDDNADPLSDQVASEIAGGVVDMINFQQNAESMRGMATGMSDQFMRGRIGKIWEAITVPGSVPCEQIEFDGEGAEFWITISYDGVCETPNGIRVGSMSMHMMGDETHSEIDIEFNDFVEAAPGQPIDDVVPSNGTMHIVMDVDGTTVTMVMTFENFTNAEGTMNGSMTITVNADGSFIRMEFEDFSNGEDRMDGSMELTTDLATTIGVVMEMSGTMDGEEFSGHYNYQLTDNGDGTSRVVGDGDWWDPAIGQTVSLEFDMTLDPVRCGDTPSEGHMTINGTDTLTLNFHCDSTTFE